MKSWVLWTSRNRISRKSWKLQQWRMSFLFFQDVLFHSDSRIRLCLSFFLPPENVRFLSSQLDRSSCLWEISQSSLLHHQKKTSMAHRIVFQIVWFWSIWNQWWRVDGGEKWKNDTDKWEKGKFEISMISRSRQKKVFCTSNLTMVCLVYVKKWQSKTYVNWLFNPRKRRMDASSEPQNYSEIFRDG